MFRGTTPTLNFKFKYNLEELNIIALYYTFKQNDTVVFEKSLSDITITNNIISISLTQEETLKISADSIVKIQGRFLIDNKAYATNVIQVKASDILKDGVIT